MLLVVALYIAVVAGAVVHRQQRVGNEGIWGMPLGSFFLLVADCGWISSAPSVWFPAMYGNPQGCCLLHILGKEGATLSALLGCKVCPAFAEGSVGAC